MPCNFLIFGHLYCRGEVKGHVSGKTSKYLESTIPHPHNKLFNQSTCTTKIKTTHIQGARSAETVPTPQCNPLGPPN